MSITETVPAQAPRKGDWMMTASGRQFWPLDPHIEDIDIQDIAHSLSRQCRFAGHCREFYSVAQHCVAVSREVPSQFALAALLHDAPEAYLVDVPRPVKRFLIGYQEAEVFLWRVIATRFGLPSEIPAEVHAADDRMVMTERRDLMPGNGPDWNVKAEPFKFEILPQWPEPAHSSFILRFRELTEPVKDAQLRGATEFMNRIQEGPQ